MLCSVLFCSVLFLLFCSVLCNCSGLRLLLGSGFVDFEKRLFLYRGMRDKAISGGFREYGRGFSYAYALPDDPNVDRNPEVSPDLFSFPLSLSPTPNYEYGS